MTLSGLAVKNIRRNRTRTVLTVLGVAVAILSFVFLRTVLDAWMTGANHAAQDRLATWHKVSFVMPLPKRYNDQLKQNDTAMRGVKATTFSVWFGAKHPTRETEFFSNLAVETETFFDVYHDMQVPPEQIQAWRDNRQGAIIGDALAKQFGWKVGDTVSLVGTIYPGDWEFKIEGVYTATKRSIDRAQFLFHYKYLNESIAEDMRDSIGWMSTTLDGSVSAGDVAKNIDALFDEQAVQTQTMSERAMQMQFAGAFSAILGALDVVSLVILAIMLLILANTIAMGVRERTHEYGVLLAIGFRPRHIAGFVVGEGVAIGLLGAGLGLLLAYPIVDQGVGRFLEENMGSWFPYFQVPTSTAVASLVIAAALGAAAAAIPAYRAAKLDVVQALRRIG